MARRLPSVLASSCVVVAIGVGTTGVHAQWTSDPLVNTPVIVASGDQATPVVRANVDGGAWFAWADNGAGGGYRHRVQRVSAAGVAAFAGPVTINSRTNSAIFVFDMDVDSAGNAYVAYDNGSIFLQKIEPTGALPWGPEGVAMPNAATVGAQVVVCGDGSLVVMWSLSNVLNFRRVSNSGALGTTWTFAEATRGQLASDMVASGPGQDFIALWVRSETTNTVTSRKGLKIQKWNGSDAAQWNGGVAVDVYASSASPSRGIQNGYFPPLVPDGQGGAIVAWYDTGAERNAWLQHYTSAGVARFPANGLAASTTASSAEFRLSASVAYDAASDQYTVSYSKSNTLQSQFGVGAQRIDAAGTRLWTGAGVDIVPVGGFQTSFVQSNRGPLGDAIVSWIQYTGTNGPMEVRSTRLSMSNGASVWAPALLGVSTTAVNKGRLGVVNSTQPGGMLVAGWADGAAGNGDILAQNINPIGTLGPLDPICDSIDFNNDTLTPDSGDLEDLLAVLAGGPTACSTFPTPGCNDIDFNNDTFSPDSLDLDAFLSRLGGGPCLQ